jgi:hypothetical protein
MFANINPASTLSAETGLLLAPNLSSFSRNLPTKSGLHLFKCQKKSGHCSTASQGSSCKSFRGDKRINQKVDAENFKRPKLRQKDTFRKEQFLQETPKTNLPH